MPYKFFNVLAVLAALGYLLIYSFWPVSIVIGEYEGVLFGNDPKSIGLTDYYSNLRHLVLPCTCLLLAFGILGLLIGSTLGRTSILPTFTIQHIPKWSIIIILGTTVCALLLWSYDPGGFWFWFFD